MHKVIDILKGYLRQKAHTFNQRILNYIKASLLITVTTIPYINEFVTELVIGSSISTTLKSLMVNLIVYHVSSTVFDEIKKGISFYLNFYSIVSGDRSF